MILETSLNLLRRYRIATLTVGLILLGIALWQAPRVSVNDSPEHWMPRSTVKNWERFAEHFAYGDTVVVGVEFREGVRDVDIDFLRSLRIDLSKIDNIISVMDVSIFAEMVEGVPLTTILETPTGERDPYGMYRGVLFDDPQVWNAASSAGDPTTENRTVLMVVEIDAETVEGLDPVAKQKVLDERRRQAIGDVYAVLDNHKRDDVTFHPAGAVVIQYELEKIARDIVVKLAPLALLLILLSLGVGFRSLQAVTIALFGGCWAIAILIGGVVIAGWSMNVVTVGGPILMIVITVATTVHFAHYYSENGTSRKGAHVRRGPARRFVRWVAVPCLGAALTTGFGFLMLTFNELKPLRELGVELFIGSILAFFGCFLIWMALPRMHAAPGRWLATEKMLPLGQAITRRPLFVLIVVTPMLCGMIVATMFVNVAVDPFAFFEKESHVAQALDHFSQRKFGHYTLDVVLIPKQTDGTTAEKREAMLQDRATALDFQNRIEGRPEVRRVISEPTMQRRLDEIRAEALEDLHAMLAAPTIAQQAEHSVEWAKDLFRAAVLKRTFKSWLTDLQGVGAMRITFLAYDPGTGFRPLMGAVRSELAAAGGERFDVFYTGTVASVAVLSEQLVGAMLRGLLAAMVVMAVVCVVLFRSVRLTMIAFLPNAFPILMVFGVMGVCSIPLDSGSAMVATIALGVGLNDTVHFVMHYRSHRVEGETCKDAVNDTFAEIARPMVLTSVVNCGGFSIFLLSDFLPMYHFGMLAGVAMIAALAGDLLLLPCLLRVFDRGEFHAKPDEIEELELASKA